MIPELNLETVASGRPRSAVLPWATLGLFVLLAVFAPWIAPYDPLRAVPSEQLQSPSWSHPFGTDRFGIDILSKIIFAARWDLTVPVLGVCFAFAIGTPLGAMSGYAGGVVDQAASRVAEVTQSFPAVLFALLVFAALGNSSPVLVGVVTFIYTPVAFKLTRAAVLPLRTADFVDAARCGGMPAPEILLRHVIPNTLNTLIPQIAVMSAYAIQIVAGLSFLGLGVPVPNPEWGSMIQEGAGFVIFGEWWPSVFPGVTIVVVVLAFQGIGRQLQARFEA